MRSDHSVIIAAICDYAKMRPDRFEFGKINGRVCMLELPRPVSSPTNAISPPLAGQDPFVGGSS